MQLLPLAHPFGQPVVQARFREGPARGWSIYELVRELAGLAGLLGWLGVLFYLIAAFAAGLPPAR